VLFLEVSRDEESLFSKDLTFSIYLWKIIIESGS
jgi:hypothetical protein